MAIEIIPVWKQVTPALRDELIGFWAANGALVDRQKAAARAAQAVVVARDGDGALTGVATCVLRVLPRLRQPMYYYRHFFAASMRGQRLTKEVANKVKEVLQAYNAGLAKPEAIGVLIELESKLLDDAYQVPYSADVDYTFIGYSPRGYKLYVTYFKEARLGPPVQLQRTAATAGRS